MSAVLGTRMANLDNVIDVQVLYSTNKFSVTRPFNVHLNSVHLT